MKVMITGARGQLGTDLVHTLADWEVLAYTHADLDVCDHAQTRALISAVKPDAVINCSAYHRVEECEDKPEKTFQVNALAVRNLAQACAESRTVFLHVSTDYVFGGDHNQPYAETDRPNPVNVYGTSKLAGEYLVQNACPRHFLVRTTGLYGVAGASGKGGNFVESMIRMAKEGKPIRVVNDQILTPTYTRDLAAKIRELLQTEAFGLYHVTSGGHCSWYDFAGQIFDCLNLHPDFGPTTTAAFAAKVKRPMYSVLAHQSLKQSGFMPLRPWRVALEAYLKEKGHLTSTVARAA